MQRLQDVVEPRRACDEVRPAGWRNLRVQEGIFESSHCQRTCVSSRIVGFTMPFWEPNSGCWCGSTKSCITKLTPFQRSVSSYGSGRGAADRVLRKRPFMGHGDCSPSQFPMAPRDVASARRVALYGPNESRHSCSDRPWNTRAFGVANICLQT